MTNYENDIMNLLEGDTPKEKYEYLLTIKPNTQRSDLFNMIIDNLEYMIILYRKEKFTQSDELKEKIIDSLDNLMKS